MTSYSYPKSRLFAIFVLALTMAAFAQPARRDKPVLRGTAVLENSSEGLRLIPICIYSAGKFYDADFYQSAPVPMSLIQGTLYEVQRAGTTVGNFTVNDAERVGAVWYGRGSFDDLSIKRRPANAVENPDDERPVLRKSAPKPAEGTSVTAPAKDDAQQANNDPDRPTLKRGAQPTPAPSAAKEPPKPPKQVIKLMNAAISDPAAPEGHSFDFNWDEAQKQKTTVAIKAMMVAELRKKAVGRGLALAPKDNIDFPEFTLRAFDVDYSNNPQVVATGRFVPTTRQMEKLTKASQEQLSLKGIMVTVVARLNYDQQLERIYAAVSDPRALGDDPALELVDAVDVDGDNRAELLFAVHTDAGRKFVVYRLYGLSMIEMFTSALR